MISVIEATGRHRSDALNWLSQHHGQDLSDDSAADGTTVLVAKDGDQLTGAIVFSVQSDGTAFVWPPVCESETICDALLGDLARRLDELGAWIGQSLLAPGATDAQRILERNGFKLLAELELLERSTDLPLPPANDHPGFESVGFDRINDDERLAVLIERTWQESLDCRGIAGARTGLDAIRGHRLCGQYDSRNWFIGQRDGNDVAVLLTAIHPDENKREVVFLGVVPEERGGGLGRHLMRFGLESARQGGSMVVRLAVDGCNRPAISIYRDLDFECVDRLFLHGRIHPARRT